MATSKESNGENKNNYSFGYQVAVFLEGKGMCVYVATCKVPH